MDRITNGKLIKTLREEKGLTQKDLSVQSHVPLMSIKRIEFSNADMSRTYASKIAGVLGVNPEDLYKTIDKTKKTISKTTVIAVAIDKGGSGKTTVTCNLGYTLSELGYKVLLIDTDHQKNLSHTFGYDENEKNFYTAFTQRQDIREHILNTSYPNLDIVVSSKSIRRIESEMVNMPFKEARLKDILDNVVSDNTYDFILIDTRPALGSYNSTILYGADEVLIPAEASEYGVTGLDNILSLYLEVKEYKPNLNILGIVINNSNVTTNLSQDAIELVDHGFGDLLLESKIRIDNNIKEAQWNHVPLKVYNKKAKANNDFELLAIEVLNILGGEDMIEDVEQ